METRRYGIVTVARIPASQVAYPSRPSDVCRGGKGIGNWWHADYNSTRARVAALGLEFVDSGKDYL